VRHSLVRVNESASTIVVNAPSAFIVRCQLEEITDHVYLQGHQPLSYAHKLKIAVSENVGEEKKPKEAKSCLSAWLSFQDDRQPMRKFIIHPYFAVHIVGLA
jgi:hypothetical protein